MLVVTFHREGVNKNLEELKKRCFGYEGRLWRGLIICLVAAWGILWESRDTKGHAVVLHGLLFVASLLGFFAAAGYKAGQT